MSSLTHQTRRKVGIAVIVLLGTFLVSEQLKIGRRTLTIISHTVPISRLEIICEGRLVLLSELPPGQKEYEVDLMRERYQLRIRLAEGQILNREVHLDDDQSLYLGSDENHRN